MNPENLGTMIFVSISRACFLLTIVMWIFEHDVEDYTFLS